MNKITAFAIRSILVDHAKSVAAKENVTNAEIVRVAIGFPYYKQDKAYAVGDICRDPDTEQPRKCVIAYDGSVNTDWTIKTATIWTPYHGIDIYTAYPWEAPTGAHDIYKAGEYMTYTDGAIYKCLSDTNFSPDDLSDAWEKVE